MTPDAMQDHPLILPEFLDHAARWHGTTEIVTACPGGASQRIGYAGLLDRARRVSAVLAARGVGAGDRVATLAWNTQAHVEVWFGTLGLGAAYHTLNPRLPADQSAAILRQGGARLLVASADLAPLAGQILAGMPDCDMLLIDADGVGEGSTSAAPLLDPLLDGDAPPVAWGGFSETAPAGLCFTSGTTGAPKGVMYTHRSTYLHTLRLMQVDTMAISAREVLMPVVPMFHANGWGIPFAAPAAGAKLVLPGRHLDGASLARLIRAEQVSVAFAVPTVWLGLVEHLEQTGGDVPSLNRIVVGGSPMPRALMTRIEQRLGVQVQTTWGMTELSPLGTIAPPWLTRRDPASAGRAGWGIDLLLTDAGGVPLPDQRGAEGHLRVRGPAVVDRYLGQTTSACDAAGWFDTGDLARIDPDGSLFITGRAKDLIKSGGEWINPAEIEAIIAALPQVALAAVVARDDPKWGERPVLVVELRQDAELGDAALRAALQGRVASWWIPEVIVRLPRMPLAATGKVDKRLLRAQFGAG